MTVSSQPTIMIEQRLLRSIDALTRWIQHVRNQPEMAPHLATGMRGEEEAFFFLRRHGYLIVARRWRTPKVPGDIDLIGWDGPTLCFVEVKTRTGRDIVPAEFAVDEHKRKMLQSMAAVYRKRLPDATRRDVPYRFDVVSVYLPTHKNAAKVDQSNAVEIELFTAAF